MGTNALWASDERLSVGNERVLGLVTNVLVLETNALKTRVPHTPTPHQKIHTHIHTAIYLPATF